MPTMLDPNAGRPARLMQWNIGMQREINRNLVVEASYVGNRGVWWQSNSASVVNLAPLNALSSATLAKYGFTDFSSATDAAILQSSISRLSAGQQAILASRGVGLPYGNFPTSQTVLQSLRDYPQYSNTSATAINGIAVAPLGKTWYDSFQLNVTQRFNHGLSFNMNYNYSKNLDLLSSPDPYNRSMGKNLSANDLPHQLRFTVQYVVPNLRKSGVGFFDHAITSQIFSGWGIGGYLNYQSAALIARPSSNGTTPISQFLGYGPGPAQLKTNADGSYVSPWSVDWTDLSGQHHTDPLDINCHCFDPTKTQVLNPNAWTNIPNGQWGAQQTSLRFFRGQRQPNENLNFSRNFRMKERVNLNIRVEFNNVFKRLRLPLPNTGVNFANAPTIGSNGMYSGGFGTFTTTGAVLLNGATGQRTGSFVARLTF
jgi:hypothetical protein